MPVKNLVAVQVVLMPMGHKHLDALGTLQYGGQHMLLVVKVVEDERGILGFDGKSAMSDAGDDHDKPC